MKSKKTLSLLLALTLAASAGIVGCGKNNTTPKDSSNASSSDKNNNKNTNKNNNNSSQKDQEEVKETSEMDKDQYLNIFLDAEPRTIDPSRATDTTSSDVNTNILDGLTRIEQENGKDKIVPGIAETWDISDDGLKWTFHLRDAKWSDGKAITADDFVYGITRTLDPNTGSTYAWIIKDVIKGAAAFNSGEGDVNGVAVKAVNDKTLEIELALPVAYFLDLSYFKVMLPQRKDMVEKYGDGFGTEAEHMLSTGAFVLKEWVHDNKMVFEKNPNYWDADNVKLEKLTMNIVKDLGSSMNMMLNASVDLGNVTRPEWKEKFDATGDFNFAAVSKPTVFYTQFNHENKYFKNVKIRKAFTIALNREDLNNSLYKGRHEPAYAFCPPAVQIAGEDFREKSDVNYIKQLIDENPDPKALLIEGLKEEGFDSDPAKMEVTKLISSTSATAKQNAEYEQDMLQKALGCKITLDYYDWAIYQNIMEEKKFDYAGGGWAGDYNDPMTFFEPMTSYSGTNDTNWKNEEYDQLVIDSTKTPDNAKRFEMFKKAEKILLYDECVVSPTIYEKSSTYTRKYVNNVMTPLFGSKYDVTRAYTSGRK
jgi:oligopeptide transport system substrate-binding protein